MNLYGFVSNNGMNITDAFGLIFNFWGTFEGSKRNWLQRGKFEAENWKASTYVDIGELTDKHEVGEDTYTQITDPNNPNCFCVSIATSKRYDLNVTSYIANDEVMGFSFDYTPNGKKAIKEHEARRVNGYAYAYSQYLSWFDNMSGYCKKCGLNEKEAQVYKNRLRSWLQDNRTEMRTKYNNESRLYQSRITGELSHIAYDGNGLVDGFTKPFGNLKPPPVQNLSKCYELPAFMRKKDDK